MLVNLQNIYAALFPVLSSVDYNYQTHCLPGPDSWCMFQADLAKKTNLYRPGKGLPLDEIKQIRPIYISLSDESEQK